MSYTTLAERTSWSEKKKCLDHLNWLFQLYCKQGRIWSNVPSISAHLCSSPT